MTGNTNSLSDKLAASDSSNTCSLRVEICFLQWEYACLYSGVDINIYLGWWISTFKPGCDQFINGDLFILSNSVGTVTGLADFVQLIALRGPGDRGFHHGSKCTTTNFVIARAASRMICCFVELNDRIATCFVQERKH